jgi:TolB-like protein/tetratricopeptide (TPR) repeat protein
MSLFGELQRRNVIKVSVAYVIVSWLLMQIADVILPTFGAPPWVMQVLVFFLALGLPVAILLAWAFEMTPDGIKATSSVEKTQSTTSKTGQRLNYIVMSLLALGVVFMVIDNYLLESPQIPAKDVDYRRGIAVIPFVNRSEAAENAEFLSDGLHDELLTRLAKVADLRVISRTSVMEYKNTTKNMIQIGEELGVGSILEGGVQRSGNTVRINMQLIDARTDEHLWAEVYDGELSAANVFAIQSKISSEIVEALQAKLSPAEQQRISAVPTENMDALEAYFSGKTMVETRSAESLLEAIEEFRKATDFDPDFSRAWAGLAEAWIELPNYSPFAEPARVRRESEIATNRAVELDPESPYALAVLGWHRVLNNHDLVGAKDAFERALEIEKTNVNALHWQSHLLSWQGLHEEAIASARAGLNSDPFSILMATNLSYILSDARLWDEAFEIGDDILRKDTYVSALENRWVSSMRARRAAEAAKYLRQWASATGRSVEAADELGQQLIRHIDLGTEEKLTESTIARLQLRAELAEVYAALGDTEGTIQSLQSAYEGGTGVRSLMSMRINPSYDFVRADLRFVELLTNVGLAE